MARVTLTSQVATLTSQVADLQRELELTKRQLADAMTEKGALLSQLATQEAEIPQAFQESYAALVDERNELIAENQRLTEAAVAVTEELDAAKERIAKQGQVIAAQPKSAPRTTVTAAVVESQTPVIQITDHDKAVYAKFQALPREQKQAYYDFAHSNGFGHLGIHNVNAIRVAFLAAKAA